MLNRHCLTNLSRSAHIVRCPWPRNNKASGSSAILTLGLLQGCPSSARNQRAIADVGSNFQRADAKNPQYAWAIGLWAGILCIIYCAFQGWASFMCPLRRLICVFAFAFATHLCSATEHILFTREGPTQGRLFISNGDGSGEQALTQPGSLDYNPAWCPKGDWIVFTSERDGPANLYRIHPNGTELHRLTEDPAYDDQAACSPDGKGVVFVTTRAAGTANLWILDLATRKTRPLTSGHGGDFRPAWSPDGKWIAFSSDRQSDLPAAKGRWERLHLVDIYLIHPDGSGLKRLTEHGNFCGTPKWTWNSNSVIVYCMSAEETYKYREPDGEDGETRIVQIDIATGATKPIETGPGVKISPSVLPSGEIAYVRRDTSAHGVFYATASRVLEAQICTPLRGLRTAPISSKADTKGSTPSNQGSSGAGTPITNFTQRHSCPHTIRLVCTLR